MEGIYDWIIKRRLEPGKTQNIVKELRTKIKNLNNKESNLWHDFKIHSDEYRIAFKIANEDFDTVTRLQYMPENSAFVGFAFIEIEGKVFGFKAGHINAHPYGEKRLDAIYIVCLNDPTLNEYTGGGTTFISVINKQWHKKVLSYLYEAGKN